jgi:hypothetical protein
VPRFAIITMPTRILLLLTIVTMLPIRLADGDDLPPVAPPYERVRYEASAEPGGCGSR